MLDDVYSRLRSYFAGSLLRRFMAITVTGLALASLAFLVILQTTQTRFVLDEYARASLTVNDTLRAALETAMLRRDLPGLRRMVDDIGRQEDVEAVWIVAPSGEVRFSDRPDRLGSRYGGGEVAAALADGQPRTRYLKTDNGRDILRSVAPVHNRPECSECHGAVASHPINGLLVVDFNAAPARAHALRAVAMQIGMGGIVMVLLAVALWWAINRFVSGRIERLRRLVDDFGGGNLSRRSTERGADEIADFGRTFNYMADRLETADAQLHTAKAAMETILEAAPDGIRVIGPDFRVLHANRTHLNRLGLPQDRVIGQPCHTLTHGRDTPCPPTLQTCPVALMRDGARNSLRFIDHFHLPGGRTMNADVIAAPIRLVIDGATRDCTIEVIRDLDADVEISHQQRLSEIALLANGVAHEINTPLSSVLLAIHAIRDDLAPASEGHTLADLVETEIRRTMDVTESLMRLSMPAARDRMPLDMAEVSSSVLRLLGPALKERAIESVFEQGDGRTMIEASDSDARMLVLNLLTNAMHAMPRGGTVTLRLQPEAEELLVSVTDTGAGIVPGDIDRIFLPFWTKRPDGSRGRGLGLSICQQVVSDIGGTIEVFSTVEKGATFVVRLPYQAEGANTTEGADPT